MPAGAGRLKIAPATAPLHLSKSPLSAFESSPLEHPENCELGEEIAQEGGEQSGGETPKPQNPSIQIL